MARTVEQCLARHVGAGFQSHYHLREGERAMLKRLSLFIVVPVLLLVGGVVAQYPLLDMIADKVIQKSQQASCEQLWQQRGQPKSAQEQEAIQLLRSDPQMRTAFINKVAAPIVNKMFECGMIP
jgi:hypothetical protein